MRNHSIARAASLVVLFGALAALRAQHPRLLFGAADIAELRAKKHTEPFASMAAVIESETANAVDWVDAYMGGHRAVACGFLYVLTGSLAWADQARALIEPIIASDHWASSGVKGLALYMHGKAVALTYDMCYGGWDDSFNRSVSDALRAHADIIHDNGGKSQNTDPASNWQGNRYSSGGLCYLATDDAYDVSNLDKCYDRVVRYCRENMGDSPDSRGWNIEGLGYTTYPFGQFIGPFGIAMARHDPERDLRNEMASVRWTPWTVYAATCAIANGGRYNAIGLHPDFGDDNPTLRAEGVYGQAFYYCYEELVPGLRYWYDRVTGPLGEGDYDRIRHGTIYGYLFYPSGTTAADPMTIPQWRQGFVDIDGNGYQTFRNRYRDENDMVAQLYVKRRGNAGHSGPDALSFRILGLNSAWAVGGGRYGPSINGQDAYLRSMNTLYPVNPEEQLYINGNNGTLVETPVLHDDGSGYAIASIDMNNVGTAAHKRWFLCDYSGSTGVDAVYVIADQSSNGLYWQMCTLEPHAVTADGNTFTIAGANGATMRGTVLHPRNTRLTTGTRIRGSTFGYHGVTYDTNRYIHFKGEGDYLVVLTAAAGGQQHPPVARSEGLVLNAVVSVGERQFGIRRGDITYDGTVDPVGTPPAAPSALQAAALDDFAEISLTWQDNANNEKGFTVYRSSDGVHYEVLRRIGTPDHTTMTDFALPASQTFYYRIVAYNDAGNSDSSNAASATTTDPASSDLIAFDSFEEALPGPLSQQLSGHGWRGGWDMNTSAVEYVGDNPLVANGIHGGNYAVRVGYGTGNDGGIRMLPRLIAQTEPVWISFLVRADAGTDIHTSHIGLYDTYRGKDLWDWQYFACAGTEWKASSNYKASSSGTPGITAGQATMAVCRVTTDSLVLWVDPSSSSDQPRVVHTPGWSFDGMLKLDGIGLSNRDRDESYLMDRLVLGKTFAAVSTQFEQIPHPVVSPHAVSGEPAQAAQPSVRLTGDLLTVVARGGPAELLLCTCTGRTVRTARIQTTATIPTGMLAHGLYLVRIRRQSRAWSMPVVVGR